MKDIKEDINVGSSFSNLILDLASVRPYIKERSIGEFGKEG